MTAPNKEPDHLFWQSESFAQAILLNIGEGIVVYDNQLRYRLWNRFMEELTGLAAEEVLGQSLLDLFSESEAVSELDLVRQALAGETLSSPDIPYAGPDGETHWILGVYSPYISPESEIIGVVATIRDITEWKQAETARQQERELAEALRDTAVALNSTLNLREVLERILANAGRVAPHDTANIMLIEGDIGRVVGGRGYLKQGLPSRIGHRFVIDTFPTLQRMIETGQPLIIPDTTIDPLWVHTPDTAWIKSYAGAPIHLRGEPVGFLNLSSATVGFFTPAYADRLEAFIEQAAIAIGNARLLRAEREQRELARQRVAELEAVRQTSLSLTSNLSLRAVLKVILERVLALVSEVQGTYIFLYQAEQLYFSAAVWTGQRKEKKVFTVVRPDKLAYQVAQQGQTIIVPDIRIHPLTQSEEEGAVVGLPLKIAQRVVGVMTVLYKQPRTWSEAELRVLHLLGDQAAVAIENARLFGLARQEIAERMRTEMELNAYQERLEALVQERTAELERSVSETAAARDKINAILHSIADGLIVTDMDNKVILANPAAEELLGFSLEEMLGQEISTSIKDDQLRAVIQDTLQKHISGYEVDIELKDSRENRRVLRTRTALVDDRAGRPLGTVTIIQDVTQLRNLDRLKSELLENVADQLRTPLTIVLGYSELLMTRDFTPEIQQRFIRSINEKSTQLDNIIKNLLDISRLEAGRGLDIKFEPLNMADLIDEMVFTFSKISSQHTIKVAGMSDLPLVRGDSFRLDQVLWNLLSNAIKYSPDGGTITLTGLVRADMLEISIEDEGIGMSQEEQVHLFEPFYRINNSYPEVNGTGLGLVISKLILEQHGGEIWLESQKGVGTTVHFSLPLADSKSV